MHLFLVDDSSVHKKVKGGDKTFIETINHSEYKNILFKKKCLRRSTNRIQSRDHRIGTYEINKISLLSFDYKIHILLIIRVNYGKTVILITIQNSF